MSLLSLPRFVPACLFLAMFASDHIHAFTVNPTSILASKPALVSSPTQLFLEDDIADMIDKELYREKHLKEFEDEWMKKNKGAILSTLNSNSGASPGMDEQELRENFRMMQRDKKLASKDPQKYCADRCISTGNCEVYEDIFDLSPTEVLEFCSNCVLGDEDEECEIPKAFYEVIDDIGYKSESSTQAP